MTAVADVMDEQLDRRLDPEQAAGRMERRQTGRGFFRIGQPAMGIESAQQVLRRP
jgi:hypothetical protein